MPFPLSPRSIEAIAHIISGGPGDSSTDPIGIYRSGPKIEQFMRGCDVDFSLTARGKFSGSRVPCLVDCLVKINRGPESKKILSEIIKVAANPQDFIDDDERYNNVLNYLNSHLRFDEFELRKDGTKTSLLVVGYSLPVLSELSRMAETIGFDTVKRDVGRALASVDDDPEDAITAACSTIESVCRSILVALGKELPNDKSIMGLFKAVKKPLGLSSDSPHMNSHIADDVKKILNGLTTVVQGATTVAQGVGALRTHGSDAHGREMGYDRIDVHLARLSIHAASTVSLFLIETWQLKFPKRALPRHDEPG